MHSDDFVEFREGILFHRNHGTVVPRIVHQDVDPAEFSASCSDYMRARSLLRQIRGCVFRAAAAVRYFLCDRGKLLLCARGKKHRCAFFGEQMSDSPADSSAGAGNERNLIFQ